MDRIPFHLPEIDETDIEAVTGVLRSKWLTTGDRCRELEARFSEFCGDAEAIATSSGTAAMHLALEACGIGPGDRVIVPVMTFTSTAEVVRYLGADPVFADVGPGDANLRTEDVLAAIEGLEPGERSRVRAIMPVHYGGVACDMTALCALAREQGWRVVDDAAHALPTTHAGQPLGSFGDASAFSFYATKSMTTGEGGMVVTRDPELAARMRVMRLHGISRDAFDRYRSDEPAWAYEIVAPGFKYNLSDLAAALGITQFARLQAMADARAAVAARYDQGFGGAEDLSLPTRSAVEQDSWHLYPLKVHGGRARRDRVIELLARDGIGTSVHFIPLHHMPYWRDRYELSAEDFPVAETHFSGEISLPIYPSLDQESTSRVIDAVLRALEATR
jgi:dTDP-4-amino-4,6-dideoxygalactose transaminase